MQRERRDQERDRQDNSGESTFVREMVIDQTSRTVASKAQKIRGGVMQRDRQQEMVKQLQINSQRNRGKLRISQGSIKVGESQDQLESQLHKERTQKRE